MGNLIFSRRSLQTRLDALGSVLPEKACDLLIARLERPGRDRLAAMWEVAMLAGFSREGVLKHEVSLVDGSRPDFSIVIAQGEASIELIGDITSVSDKGIDKQNPVREFGDHITRLARKHGLDPNHFRYDIKGRFEGVYGDSRSQVLLPRATEMTALLKDEIEPFLRELARTPRPQASLPHKAPGIDFTISYDQSQRFAGGGYPAYNLAYSKTKNPIYTALDKKASQLRHAPPGTIRIIVVCDGGCRPMQDQRPGMGPSYAGRNIADSFLARTTAVDLVLLVTTERVNPSTLARDPRLRLRCDLVAPLPRRRHERLSEKALAAVQSFLERSFQHLPTPMIDPENARIRGSKKDYGFGLHGDYQVSGNSVRISSRVLLELLAGQTNFERFAQLHGWEKSPFSNHRNPLELALKRGDMIDSVSVIDGADHDDDWIEIHLRSSDPAISSFRPRGKSGPEH